MAIRNLNWYNLQATRRYPLDDSCSGETDTGQNFANDILVDCHIRFDKSYGKYAYVQAVTVSASIVTAVIGASDSLDAGGTTIAAVSITKPAAININYPIKALVTGAAGWIVFGAGIDSEPASYRFSTPRQSLLAARCARAYNRLPISSLKKAGNGSSLQGVVNLAAESPMKVEHKKVTDESGKEKQLLIFSLDTADTSLEYNPISYFLNECGKRPESETCPKTPIATINGVAPDCFGDIKIVFTNIDAQPFADCGGVDLITTYGLNKACQGPPDLPLFYSDLCCPRRFDTIGDRDAAPINELSVNEIVRVGVGAGADNTEYQYYKVAAIDGTQVTWEGPLADTDENLRAALSKCDWPDPTTLIPDVVVTLPAIQDYPLAQLPACIDFCSCDATPPMFDAIQGVFSGAKTPAPFGCYPCGLDEGFAPDTQADAFALTNHNTYRAIDNGEISLSLFKNAASDWAFGRTITTQLKLSSDGRDRNGGLVLNYRKIRVNGVEQTRYYAAVVDVALGRLQLLDYTNSAFTVLATVPMPVKTNQWYKISARPTISGAYVYLNIVAEEIIVNGYSARIIDHRVALGDYEPQTGAFGLYAARSYTYFNAFTIA